jgi:CRISPR-associated protein Csm3
MSESLDFHRFLITGDLMARTALHIGAGDTDFTPGAMENGVLRDSRGRYFIPGSSLKGVSRAYVERSFLGQNNICINGNCAIRYKEKKERDQLRDQIKKEYQQLHKKKPEEPEVEAELSRQILNHLCPICRLFGSQVNAGQLKIRDAYPKTAPFQTELRPHVSIDRETRTNVSGRFYKDEVIPADSIFTFSAVLNRPDADVLPYVAYLVDALKNEEITVGGMSSRGLGVVALENVRIKYQGGLGLASEWKDCNLDLLQYFQACLGERKDA